MAKNGEEWRKYEKIGEARRRMGKNGDNRRKTEKIGEG